MYSAAFLEQYGNQRFRGPIEDATHRGHVGQPDGGPYITIHLRVENGVIAQVGFETYACAATIACGSMVATLAHEKRVAEAKKIRSEDVVEGLGGLPRSKMHCADRAVTALRIALDTRVR